MSVAQQTRGRLNMQPPRFDIYASQSRTENARSCADRVPSAQTVILPVPTS
jgi:hypothetical protein